eukprot:9388763-Pyramimonas_sp.AAC.2
MPTRSPMDHGVHQHPSQQLQVSCSSSTPRSPAIVVGGGLPSNTPTVTPTPIVVVVYCELLML